MVLGQMDLPLEKIAAICRKYRVKELSIFGSVLRDDFQAQSDVDVLMDFLPAHGLGLIDYLGCKQELSDVMGRQVDLEQKSGLKRYVGEEVLRTQRVIYAS